MVAAARRIYERHPDETVLVVTHIGPLLVLYCWAVGLPLGSTDASPHAHGALSCVRWNPAGPVVEFWNDRAHAGP